MKIKRISSLLLVVITVFFSFISCGDQNSEGSATIVVAGSETKEYTVELSEIEITQGLVSILDYLKEEGALDYGITGTYLDYVGDVKNDYATGSYIYVYTSVEKDQDVSEYRATVEYNGTLLTSSGVGALEMTVEDGAVIYIGTIQWD